MSNIGGKLTTRKFTHSSLEYMGSSPLGIFLWMRSRNNITLLETMKTSTWDGPNYCKRGAKQFRISPIPSIPFAPRWVSKTLSDTWFWNTVGLYTNASRMKWIFWTFHHSVLLIDMFLKLSRNLSIKTNGNLGSTPCLWYHPPMTFFSDIHWFVPGDFVEIAPFSSVLLCLPITVLFLWLGLVFKILFVRAIFIILWLLHIFRPKLPFVMVLKFLLNFKNISIRSTEWWDVQNIHFSLDVSM